MIPRVWLVPVQGGLVNTRNGQKRLRRQLLPKCTFSVGIVAMARVGRAAARDRPGSISETFGDARQHLGAILRHHPIADGASLRNSPVRPRSHSSSASRAITAFRLSLFNRFSLREAV